jgi:hypothetical protein
MIFGGAALGIDDITHALFYQKEMHQGKYILLLQLLIY